MKTCRHSQLNMFLAATQKEIRIPQIARDQVKELLGKVMVTALEEEKRKENIKEKQKENLSLKAVGHE